MDDRHPEIIIIKRRHNAEEEHHGGAWKIAFADFMTAMMAFFLVLWIVNATDKNTKTMIARYFNPVKMEEATRTPKNIRSNGPSAAVDLPVTKEPTPTDVAGSPESSDPAPADSTPAHGIGGPQAKPIRSPDPGTDGAPDPAYPKSTMSEGVLFADPYRSLNAIAGPASPDLRVVEQSGKARDRHEAGTPEPETIRDPFRPNGRVTSPDALDGGAPAPPQQTGAPAKTQLAAPPPPPAQTQASDAQAKASAPPAPSGLEISPPALAPVPTGASEAAQKSLTETAARLQKELELQLGAPGVTPGPGPAIEVKATEEGLLISLTDRMNYSMFPIGSAEPQRQVIQAMDAVARILKDRPGTIVVRGHTDGHPYKSAVYDNWRLSAARAQIAYYMLARAGVPESRFDRIEGYADRRLKDADHPFAAENRRIEILVRESKS
jgi:chemotaxis protein MotB